VKLVVRERETDELTRTLSRWASVATSIVARVEVSRAVLRLDPGSVGVVDSRLGELVTLELDDATLERAARIEPATLRSLNAIHLASAEQLGESLAVFIAYDDRLLAAAEAHGFTVACPGRERPGAVP
jgi:predicted nucleic acid-binding protein